MYKRLLRLSNTGDTKHIGTSNTGNERQFHHKRLTALLTVPRGHAILTSHLLYFYRYLLYLFYNLKSMYNVVPPKVSPVASSLLLAQDALRVALVLHQNFFSCFYWFLLRYPTRDVGMKPRWPQISSWNSKILSPFRLISEESCRLFVASETIVHLVYSWFLPKKIEKQLPNIINDIRKKHSGGILKQTNFSSS